MAIRLLYRLFLQQLGQRRAERAGAAGAATVPRPPAHRGRHRRLLKLSIALAVPLAAIFALNSRTFDPRAPSVAGPGAKVRLEIGVVTPGPLVVYLSGAGLAPPDLALSAAGEIPLVESIDATFAPRFQVLPPGSPLMAVNSDPIPHNTHVFNRGETVFNVALPLEGVRVKKTVTGSEIFSVRCDLHPWMQAWLFVPPSRHYAVLHEPGTVEFDEIPAGEYLLHLWQPDRLEGIHSLSLSDGQLLTLRLR